MTSMGGGRVAVIVLTLNEELHIERALRSVAPFARSLHIVDSGSTDRTRDLARAAGAQVLEHGWTNHAEQFQWAVDNVDTDADWILRLDADEVIEADLGRRIAGDLPELGEDVAGVTFDRQHLFMGRRLRHGGRGDLRMLRLFRRGQGRIEQRWMDEHIVVADGARVVHFAGGFVDHNLKDLACFTAKHNAYATLEAVDVLLARHGLQQQADVRGRAGLRRWVKARLYGRLPFPLGPLAYFLYRYVLRLGFLDGREGLIYHALQGGWYRFLVGARVQELDRQLAGSTCIRTDLRRLTGLRIE